MKESRSINIKNATLNVDEDLIIEERKDEVINSSLSKLLKSWDGISGISITIKKDSEDTSNETVSDVDFVD